MPQPRLPASAAFSSRSCWWMLLSSERVGRSILARPLLQQLALRAAQLAGRIGQFRLRLHERAGARRLRVHVFRRVHPQIVDFLHRGGRGAALEARRQPLGQFAQRLADDVIPLRARPASAPARSAWPVDRAAARFPAVRAPGPTPACPAVRPCPESRPGRRIRPYPGSSGSKAAQRRASSNQKIQRLRARPADPAAHSWANCCCSAPTPSVK